MIEDRFPAPGVQHHRQSHRYRLLGDGEREAVVVSVQEHDVRGGEQAGQIRRRHRYRGVAGDDRALSICVSDDDHAHGRRAGHRDDLDRLQGRPDEFTQCVGTQRGEQCRLPAERGDRTGRVRRRTAGRELRAERADLLPRIRESVHPLSHVESCEPDTQHGCHLGFLQTGKVPAMVTMRDVAALAGVSITTVSHVINETRPVAEDTRERVQKAIDETGYTGDAIARSLVMGGTKSLGLAVSLVSHPYFAELIAAIESEATRNGVGVTAKGEVVFVVSKRPVRFHDFATLFRDALDCPNALFLDGTISSVYAPEINRHDRLFPLGPMIAVVGKFPR